METTTPQDVIKTIGGVVGGYLRKTRELGIVHVLQRSVRVISFLLLHPVLSTRLFRVLLQPGLSKRVKKDPTVFVKFAWRVYARGLSIVERAVLIEDHYQCLLGCLNPGFLDAVFSARATLWEFPIEQGSLQIGLDTGPAGNEEGELVLHFLVNETDVYSLQFVIAPGNLGQMDVGRAIYVTGLQGTKGCAHLIKLATKSACDVAPPLVLMATLEGVARALDIEHIFGICATANVCAPEGPRIADFVSAYDEFWRSIEGRQLSSGWFHLTVPLQGPPWERIKPNHRSRVRARRTFRNGVSNHVHARVRPARLDPGYRAAGR